MLVVPCQRAVGGVVLCLVVFSQVRISSCEHVMEFSPERSMRSSLKSVADLGEVEVSLFAPRNQIGKRLFGVSSPYD